MRILVNFRNCNGWTVYCLAEDCVTRIGPFLDVASLATLRRMLEYAGADAGEMEHFEHAVRSWDRGSVWISNLTEVGATLLGIPVDGRLQKRTWVWRY